MSTIAVVLGMFDESIMALLPFAALAQDHIITNVDGTPYPDDRPVFAINGEKITVGDLIRAKKVLDDLMVFGKTLGLPK